MNKFLLCVFLGISSFVSLLAQEGLPRNASYIEVGGAGLFGSVNYERQLGKKPGVSLRAGLGYYSENGNFLTIPLGINYLFELKNKKNFFIEGGLTATFARRNAEIFKNNLPNDAHDFYLVPSIGYRKHTPKNLMWRVSVAAVIHKNTTNPWAGFAIGKLF